ncbi:hypothetical protein [Eilatimonas milleporae]|uniref:Uncharacterized protein n=1 Tax=Eilatimonas milleporae TaxID=911205 RepID=A0A3M0CTK8_9PROT|nr:hypothetical protein [Eilatimonas milleporae]RMB12295.1 hypothetical protein BXY39_0788 [Eilatimonas milleporae]
MKISKKNVTPDYKVAVEADATQFEQVQMSGTTTATGLPSAQAVLNDVPLLPCKIYTDTSGAMLHTFMSLDSTENTRDGAAFDLPVAGVSGFGTILQAIVNKSRDNISLIFTANGALSASMLASFQKTSRNTYNVTTLVFDTSELTSVSREFDGEIVFDSDKLKYYAKFEQSFYVNSLGIVDLTETSFTSTFAESDQAPPIGITNPFALADILGQYYREAIQWLLLNNSSQMGAVGNLSYTEHVLFAGFIAAYVVFLSLIIVGLIRAPALATNINNVTPSMIVAQNFPTIAGSIGVITLLALGVLLVRISNIALE